MDPATEAALRRIEDAAVLAAQAAQRIEELLQRIVATFESLTMQSVAEAIVEMQRAVSTAHEQRCDAPVIRILHDDDDDDDDDDAS